MRDTLERCLREASTLVMSYYKKAHSPERKSDNSIVTEADVQAEKLIAAIIRERFPEHGIVGEELGYQEGNKYLWVIDPIDGTAQFAVGMPGWGIMIALMKDFEPILAGISFPDDDLLYLAEKFKGATCNGKPIRVSGEQELRNVLVAFGTDRKPDEENKREGMLYATFVQKTRYVCGMNGCIVAGYVADGRLGGAVCFSSKLWDVVAPALIIEEAGGVVSDPEGKPLQYTFRDLKQNFPTVFSTSLLHPQMMVILKSQS